MKERRWRREGGGSDGGGSGVGGGVEGADSSSSACRVARVGSKGSREGASSG